MRLAEKLAPHEPWITIDITSPAKTMATLTSETSHGSRSSCDYDGSVGLWPLGEIFYGELMEVEENGYCEIMGE